MHRQPELCVFDSVAFRKGCSPYRRPDPSSVQRQKLRTKCHLRPHCRSYQVLRIHVLVRSLRPRSLASLLSPPFSSPSFSSPLLSLSLLVFVMDMFNSFINDRPALSYRPDYYRTAHLAMLPDAEVPAQPAAVITAVLLAVAGLPENVDALVDGEYRLVDPCLFGPADVHVSLRPPRSVPRTPCWPPPRRRLFPTSPIRSLPPMVLSRWKVVPSRRSPPSRLPASSGNHATNRLPASSANHVLPK